MIDKEKLEIIFKMYNMQILRDIAYNKDVAKTRSKDDLIKKLLGCQWTDEEFKSHIKFSRLINEEKKPISDYIAKIESVDLEVLKNKLENDKVEIGKVDGKSTLIANGFEIREYEENKYLRVIEWKKKYNQDIGPFGEIIEYPIITKTEFIVDKDKGLLFIHNSAFKSATSIKATLELQDVKLENVGLQKLTRKVANEKFHSFVNELESKLTQLSGGEDNAEGSIRD